MYKEFKAFLQKYNVMALAVAFILGAAVGKVVTALVTDLIMPLIGLVMPSVDWKLWFVELGSQKFMVGDFIGAVVDFVIIAFVVFVIGKMLLKPEPTPETKTCPHCLEVIAAGASYCKYCTQPQAQAVAQGS
jgi:large conductance mechanosensitive channel